MSSFLYQAHQFLNYSTIYYYQTINDMHCIVLYCIVCECHSQTRGGLTTRHPYSRLLLKAGTVTLSYQGQLHSPYTSASTAVYPPLEFSSTGMSAQLAVSLQARGMTEHTEPAKTSQMVTEPHKPQALMAV